MRSIRHLTHYISVYGSNHKVLWLVASMTLFFALFDGINGYALPLLLLQKGVSQTTMGLIISTSSLAGGIFDFFLVRFIQKTHFRRLYLLMIIVGACYPLVLYSAQTIPMFIMAMALWGLYFDFQSFGHLDFVARRSESHEHADAFGVIDVFKSIGYLLAPLFAGLVVSEVVDWKPGFLSVIFLGLCVFFYVVLANHTKSQHREKIADYTYAKRKIWSEVTLLRKIGRLILPVMLLCIFLNVYDSFFWTIGPVLSENLKNLHPFGGLFITLYFLPTLLTGWFVGRITGRFGKKATAYVGLFLGSLLMTSLLFFSSTIGILIVVFLSSSLTVFAWPAMRGSIADFISETPKVEPEIEGLGDFSANFGYIIGPALAGFVAERVGEVQSFGILGIIGMTVASLLFLFGRQSITIPKRVG
jgi:MFS family permease